ncbi:hypothetical protein PCANC_20216 [Puccinia coronata f. sp. avenae]|uniref:Uncharacterized protein n=1 Tax=Puccinia coronata f. sp. avenae TaxID=200324 RepID=A0A2N5U3S8_9BASI|nr:hypothetical protein PCANC_20216 [Puccinia coronata f. sp. avenae]
MSTLTPKHAAFDQILSPLLPGSMVPLSNSLAKSKPATQRWKTNSNTFTSSALSAMMEALAKARTALPFLFMEEFKVLKGTGSLKTSIPITAFFSKRPAAELSNPAAPKVQIKESTSKAEISEMEKQQLQDTVVQEATWEICRHNGCRSIHSTNEYANGETLKYVRKSFMAGDPFQEKQRKFKQVNLLATHLERAAKKDNKTFQRAFASQAEAGKFDDLKAFKGLVMAVAVRNKREKDGKELTGVRFLPQFDEFMGTLAALSPRGAQLFWKTFAGRTLRSQRDLCAKNSSQLADGISLVNFEQISSILKELTQQEKLARMAASELILDAAIQFKLGRRATESIADQF